MNEILAIAITLTIVSLGMTFLMWILKKKGVL